MTHTAVSSPTAGVRSLLRRRFREPAFWIIQASVLTISLAHILVESGAVSLGPWATHQAAGHVPVILYLASPGPASGPKNSPRTWHTARWTGDEWEVRKAFTSDNNYDCGELSVERLDCVSIDLD